MAILDIVLYPHPVLLKDAKPVPEVTDQIRALIDDMVETMYQAPGVGLAAPQIGKSLQICVADINSGQPDKPKALYVCINPKIVSASGSITWEEGCLSLPKLYRDVTRPEHVVIESLDYHGNPQRIEAHGFLAVCLQHEIDHLKGVVFVDRLAPKQRKSALKEWQKIKMRIHGHAKKKKVRRRLI